jgi:heme/copper-type cytochrome/quinol oxidase subunit 3
MTTDVHAGVAGHLDPESAGRMNKLGVILLIVGDAAFTLSLVFTYLYLRGLNTNGRWLGPNGAHVVGSGYSWAIVGVALVSWLAYRWGERGGNDKARIALGAGIACVLVVVDIAMQVAQMTGAGFTPRDGAYQSAWMALAGYHVVHLLLTLFMGIAIVNRARLGRFAVDAWQVRLVGYWWTWVAVAAVIIAATTSFTTVAHP